MRFGLDAYETQSATSRQLTRTANPCRSELAHIGNPVTGGALVPVTANELAREDVGDRAVREKSRVGGLGKGIAILLTLAVRERSRRREACGRQGGSRSLGDFVPVAGVGAELRASRAVSLASRVVESVFGNVTVPTATR